MDESFVGRKELVCWRGKPARSCDVEVNNAVLELGHNKTTPPETLTPPLIVVHAQPQPLPPPSPRTAAHTASSPPPPLHHLCRARARASASSPASALAPAAPSSVVAVSVTPSSVVAASATASAAARSSRSMTASSAARRAAADARRVSTCCFSSRVRRCRRSSSFSVCGGEGQREWVGGGDGDLPRFFRRPRLMSLLPHTHTHRVAVVLVLVPQLAYASPHL